MKFGQELSFDTPISSQTFTKDPKFTRLKTDIGHSQLYKCLHYMYYLPWAPFVPIKSTSALETVSTYLSLHIGSAVVWSCLLSAICKNNLYCKNGKQKKRKPEHKKLYLYDLWEYLIQRENYIGVWPSWDYSENFNLIQNINLNSD